MKCREQFENELRRRGLQFSVDPTSGCYVFAHNGIEFQVSLANLERGYVQDRDPARVRRFVDTVLSTMADDNVAPTATGLYWSLEPSDYEHAPPIREALSGEVDRVLVHVSGDMRRISWVMPEHLQALRMSEAQAADRASTNLARAIAAAALTVEDIDGVPLAYLDTELPFKSALILAPNVKEALGKRIGWPLLAVVPDRDFLYLWPAEHTDFAGRVGNVVVREYSSAPYPVSTEVYELSDDGLRAIGAFPRPERS